MSIAKKENPFVHFSKWYDEAKNNPNIEDHSAVILATADKQGRPSARAVLLKAFDERGFVFYTNFESQKGKELLENPYAALCFYWEALGKQIRIEGKTERVSDRQADEYFDSRPLQSRIGAWASRQSRELTGRFELEKRVAKYTAKFAFKKVPRPDYWSGFRLLPEKIEFWKSGAFRLHDRLVYYKKEGAWESKFLFP